MATKDDLKGKGPFTTDKASRSSRSVFSAANSLYAAQARAKAEAAKVRAKYLEQEAALKRQQALLNIDLELLKERKICAEAEAEANAYDEYETIDEYHTDLHLPEESAEQRTERFISDSPCNFNQEHQFSTEERESPRSPNLHSVSNMNSSYNSEATKQITDFLLRKELLTSRIPVFDDDPTTYCVWKSSFTNTTSQVTLNVQEKIDILINHLSLDSRRQALSIKSSNSAYPERALRKIWERLDDRFGAPELIENRLKSRLLNFPNLTSRDDRKYYELYDLLTEIESFKEDIRYSALLAYYDTSVGVNPILRKLPVFMQSKWIDKASAYKEKHSVVYPPFTFFVDFIKDTCKRMNDPSFILDPSKVYGGETKQSHYINATTRKTDLNTDQSTEGSDLFTDCPFHRGSPHSLNNCREFCKKDLQERKQFLREKGICYRCCNSDKHLSKDCTIPIKCEKCQSSRHSGALHFYSTELNAEQPKEVKCTKVCGQGYRGRSCAKTLLVNVRISDKEDRHIPVYAILDEQSNCSLASSALLDKLNRSNEQINYQMASCSGTHRLSGRRIHSLQIRSVDNLNTLTIPTVYECQSIPQNYSEIPTPEVARSFPHLQRIADHMSPLNSNIEIALLIGRDVIEAHHILEQIVGSKEQPFAQRVMLGWVIIGEVCLGKVHIPNQNELKVSTFKTNMLSEDRASIFEPCHSNIVVKALESDKNVISPFYKQTNDEKLGLSIEDREFLDLMDKEVFAEEGHWVAPLPFRKERPKLPNNKMQALQRARSLDANLSRNPQKQQDFVEFMQKVFDQGHAELAPKHSVNDEDWYLPIFGVYHPRKPNQVRVVFDSSSTYEGISLNSILLQGPDLTNNLLGILLRFRMDSVAITADIEQMFYCFSVSEKHRNFLKFLWHEQNDPEKPLVEYRMKKHVFGNSPSPAVATYCLRKSVEHSEETVKKFVNEDFYVDDGLASCPSPEKAVELLKKTQNELSKKGLRLHKIASNHSEVMKSFSLDDLAKNLVSVDFETQSVLPSQRSLGLEWDLNLDSFIFKMGSENKPFTKRGILSTINSIFDPIGFLTPIVLRGKLILREVVSNCKGWDEPITPDLESKWVKWKESLQDLGQVSIPRCYLDSSLTHMTNVVIHVFSDASEKAISSVVFLSATDEAGSHQVGFVMGKSKVAPSHGHTIPRLELCAALLSVQLAEIVSDSLHLDVKSFRFYTDSRVVLGYLNNRIRRFHNYVCNRVQRILSLTKPDQWIYVSTQNNPADHGTRGLASCSEVVKKWLSPSKQSVFISNTSEVNAFPLIDPDHDKEIRVQVTKSVVTQPIRHRFAKFSNWTSLVRSFALLIRVASAYQSRSRSDNELSDLSKSENFIIQQEQSFMFPEEVACLREGKQVSKKSILACLNPFLDCNCIIRVKGRLNQSFLPRNEINPVILPRQSHIAKLIVTHYHEKVKHQGRLLTEGTVRSNGFWIIGAKSLISSILHHCVPCRKLRGKESCQLMADLPHLWE